MLAQPPAPRTPRTMQLYSTNDPTLRVDFAEAVFRALPRDRGLYMPVEIPRLPEAFWRALPGLTLPEIGFAITSALLRGALPDGRIRAIVDAAIDFPAPLVRLDEGDADAPACYVLELFHGPSLAFKDFGARFMAGVMDELSRERSERVLILVATSGDTGGAVAAGFHGSENVDVVILYPAGKVSDIQEAQLTTLGGNVTALRVDGTFDDCQALVKEAFVDAELRAEANLSSANSINILRLIPQSFYYVEAYRQWCAAGQTEAPVFAVPSGNFGNLTAGLLAQRMGLPVAKFVAATNANDTVARYHADGAYEPRPSVRTISNAMDVGAPSNFARMSDLFGATWDAFREHVWATSFDDAATEREMAAVYEATARATGSGYVLDPHTAVGTLALKRYWAREGSRPGIVLATAHPGKFLPDVERVLGREVPLPPALEAVRARPRTVRDIGDDYAALREVVLARWRRGPRGATPTV